MMDEFYIVKQYLDGVNNGVLYCASRDFAESNIHDSPYLDPRVSFSLHHMVRLDKFTGELYVEVNDNDLVECPNCYNIIKFKGQWVSYSDELAQLNSNGAHCGRCSNGKQAIKVDYHQVLEYIQAHGDLSFILVIYANDTGVILDPSKPLNLPPNTVAMSFEVNREISTQIKVLGAGKVGELLQYINSTSDKVVLSDGIPF